ncbi:hypothetical protein CHS0354_028143 [Potamilus streckersoni]|uniref:TASOR pseudo-PARP domain-containing protein n=1 Tax=Potamilus streckersoni TaxID=2493646 RepID=A0AAE0TI15_9BIVA|nr:hypothetical protein CHS0354_028143 [Potamilus streckersoni]
MSETNTAVGKIFNIPKIKRQGSKDNLRTVTPDSRDAKEVVSVVEHSYLDTGYRGTWQLKTMQLVENKDLEENYRKKKQDLKDEGRHSRDLVDHYAFLLFRDTNIVTKIAKNGLQVRPLPFNALGDSKLGLYVCRNADIQFRLADSWNIPFCVLIVFKVILGRCKSLVLHPFTETVETVEPTPNFDCHVSQVISKPNDPISIQLARSQIYLYEYNEDCVPSKSPRQCLPYAILTYEKKEGPETSVEGQSYLRVNPSLKPGYTGSRTVRTAFPSEAPERGMTRAGPVRSLSTGIPPSSPEGPYPPRGLYSTQEGSPMIQPITKLNEIPLSPVDPRLEPRWPSGEKYPFGHPPFLQFPFQQDPLQSPFQQQPPHPPETTGANRDPRLSKDPRVRAREMNNTDCSFTPSSIYDISNGGPLKASDYFSSVPNSEPYLSPGLGYDTLIHGGFPPSGAEAYSSHAYMHPIITGLPTSHAPYQYQQHYNSTVMTSGSPGSGSVFSVSAEGNKISSDSYPNMGVAVETKSSVIDMKEDKTQAKRRISLKEYKAVSRKRSEGSKEDMDQMKEVSLNQSFQESADRVKKPSCKPSPTVLSTQANPSRPEDKVEVTSPTRYLKTMEELNKTPSKKDGYVEVTSPTTKYLQNLEEISKKIRDLENSLGTGFEDMDPQSSQDMSLILNSDLMESVAEESTLIESPTKVDVLLEFPVKPDSSTNQSLLSVSGVIQGVAQSSVSALPHVDNTIVCDMDISQSEDETESPQKCDSLHIEQRTHVDYLTDSYSHWRHSDVESNAESENKPSASENYYETFSTHISIGKKLSQVAITTAQQSTVGKSVEYSMSSRTKISTADSLSNGTKTELLTLQRSMFNNEMQRKVDDGSLYAFGTESKFSISENEGERRTNEKPLDTSLLNRIANSYKISSTAVTSSAAADLSEQSDYFPRKSHSYTLADYDVMNSLTSKVEESKSDTQLFDAYNMHIRAKSKEKEMEPAQSQLKDPNITSGHVEDTDLRKSSASFGSRNIFGDIDSRCKNELGDVDFRQLQRPPKQGMACSSSGTTDRQQKYWHAGQTESHYGKTGQVHPNVTGNYKTYKKNSRCELFNKNQSEYNLYLQDQPVSMTAKYNSDTGSEYKHKAEVDTKNASHKLESYNLSKNSEIPGPSSINEESKFESEGNQETNPSVPSLTNVHQILKSVKFDLPNLKEILANVQMFPTESENSDTNEESNKTEDSKLTACHKKNIAFNENGMKDIKKGPSNNHVSCGGASIISGETDINMKPVTGVCMKEEDNKEPLANSTIIQSFAEHPEVYDVQKATVHMPSTLVLTDVVSDIILPKSEPKQSKVHKYRQEENESPIPPEWKEDSIMHTPNKVLEQDSELDISYISHEGSLISDTDNILDEESPLKQVVPGLDLLLKSRQDSLKEKKNKTISKKFGTMKECMEQTNDSLEMNTNFISSQGSSDCNLSTNVDCRIMTDASVPDSQLLSSIGGEIVKHEKKTPKKPKKINKDMMGYRTRKRRRKKRALYGTDIKSETSSIVSSLGDEDFGEDSDMEDKSDGEENHMEDTKVQEEVKTTDVELRVETGEGKNNEKNDQSSVQEHQREVEELTIDESNLMPVDNVNVVKEQNKARKNIVIKILKSSVGRKSDAQDNPENINASIISNLHPSSVTPVSSASQSATSIFTPSEQIPTIQGRTIVSSARGSAIPSLANSSQYVPRTMTWTSSLEETGNTFGDNISQNQGNANMGLMPTPSPFPPVPGGSRQVFPPFMPPVSLPGNILPMQALVGAMSQAALTHFQSPQRFAPVPLHQSAMFFQRPQHLVGAPVSHLPRPNHFGPPPLAIPPISQPQMSRMPPGIHDVNIRLPPPGYVVPPPQRGISPVSTQRILQGPPPVLSGSFHQSSIVTSNILTAGINSSVAGNKGPAYMSQMVGTSIPAGKPIHAIGSETNVQTNLLKSQQSFGNPPQGMPLSSNRPETASLNSQTSVGNPIYTIGRGNHGKGHQSTALINIPLKRSSSINASDKTKLDGKTFHTKGNGTPVKMIESQDKVGKPIQTLSEHVIGQPIQTIGVKSLEKMGQVQTPEMQIQTCKRSVDSGSFGSKDVKLENSESPTKEYPIDQLDPQKEKQDLSSRSHPLDELEIKSERSIKEHPLDVLNSNSGKSVDKNSKEHPLDTLDPKINSKSDNKRKKHPLDQLTKSDVRQVVYDKKRSADVMEWFAEKFAPSKKRPPEKQSYSSEESDNESSHHSFSKSHKRPSVSDIDGSERKKRRDLFFSSFINAFKSKEDGNNELDQESISALAEKKNELMRELANLGTDSSGPSEVEDKSESPGLPADRNTRDSIKRTYSDIESDTDLEEGEVLDTMDRRVVHVRDEGPKISLASRSTAESMKVSMDRCENVSDRVKSDPVVQQKNITSVHEQNRVGRLSHVKEVATDWSSMLMIPEEHLEVVKGKNSNRVVKNSGEYCRYSNTRTKPRTQYDQSPVLDTDTSQFDYENRSLNVTADGLTSAASTTHPTVDINFNNSNSEFPISPKALGNEESLLSKSAELISKKREKMIASSQVKTLEEWLKVEFDLDNVQHLAKFIPFSLDTSFPAISKVKRRKLKQRVRAILESKGNEVIKTASNPQVQLNSPGMQIQSQSLFSRPEVSGTQIQKELKIVKKALDDVRNSRKSPLKNLNSVVSWQQSQSNAIKTGESLRLQSALVVVELDMKNMLQRTCFYGYPHRKIPSEVLLDSEISSLKSEEEVFLIIISPLSSKSFTKLVGLKHKIESMLRLKANPVNLSAERQKSIMADIKKLHNQRQNIMRPFTGYLNKKRQQKLEEQLEKYQLVHEYLKRQSSPVPDSQLKYLKTTMEDIKDHLTMVKQYQVFEDSSKKETTETTKTEITVTFGASEFFPQT